MDPLSADLARLAATGRFGDFFVGARLPDLIAAKGEPEWSGRIQAEYRWPHWFCYGGLEIVFCRCRLLDRMFVPVWRDGLEIPGAGRAPGYTVTTPVTESGFTAALTAAGIAWRTQWSPTLPDQRTLLTDPAPGIVADFVFVAPDGEDPATADWPLEKAGTYGLNHGACPEPDPDLPDDGYGA